MAMVATCAVLRLSMGKLAERLADERRSGVYRVETIDVLEEAAAIDRYPIARVRLGDADRANLQRLCVEALALSATPGWHGFATALADPAWSPAPGHVLLFDGFESLGHAEPEALVPLLDALRTAAARRRGRGMRFFAVFLDPARLLALDPLYNWLRNPPAAVASLTEQGQGGGTS